MSVSPEPTGAPRPARSDAATGQPAGPPADRLVARLDGALAPIGGGLLRLEDGLLALWLVLGLPVARVAGDALAGAGGAGGAANAADPLGKASDPLSGLLGLAAVILAVAVVATRSPGDPVIGFDGIATPRSYAPLPFLLSLSIVADTALGRLGLDSDGVIGPIFIMILACYVLYPRLPSLPRAVRRLMMVPFILIAGSVFGGIVSDLAGLFDYRALLGDPAATPAAFAGLLGLQVLFSGLYYLAFVFAPRMVAEAEGSWKAWLVRYTLFLGATIVSVTFLGAAGG